MLFFENSMHSNENTTVGCFGSGLNSLKEQTPRFDQNTNYSIQTFHEHNIFPIFMARFE